ncbi:MAG TPA: PP2C family protein-serine/threonine phosphatase [Candidatus Eisenbacteria bacterium]|nr:PP2C family protein-serine/threonine phosphatase [Candidatus Eisenbacteria bacterium]
MKRAMSQLHWVIVAMFSAGLLWLVIDLGTSQWQRVAVLAAGTPLLVVFSEAARRAWLEKPSESKVSRPSARADRLADDLAVGFDLQRRFLPAEQDVHFAGLHVAGRCVPARGVSGDTFDFGTLLDDSAMLLLADVAGKGIPAAILMAVFHSSFRSRIALSVELVKIFEGLNAQIHALSGPNRFVTAFCGIFDRRNGSLRFVNAGHLPPLLCRVGALEELHAGGIPIGIFANAPYESGETRLEPGDLLVIYSDGAIEAVNKAGEEFGRERFEKLVLEHAARPVSEIRDVLFEALEHWNDDFIQEDDITILVVRREHGDMVQG